MNVWQTLQTNNPVKVQRNFMRVPMTQQHHFLEQHIAAWADCASHALAVSAVHYEAEQLLSYFSECYMLADSPTMPAPLLPQGKPEVQCLPLFTMTDQ